MSRTGWRAELRSEGAIERGDDGAALAGAVKASARALGFDGVGVVPPKPMPEVEAAMRERIEAGAFGGLPWFNLERAYRACNVGATLPWIRSLIVVTVNYHERERPPVAPTAHPSESSRDTVSSAAAVDPTLEHGRWRQPEADPAPTPYDVPTEGRLGRPASTGPGADSGNGAGLADTEGVRSARPRGVVARYARGHDYHDVLRSRLERLAGEIERLAGRTVQHKVFVDTSALAERELARRAGLGWFGKNSNVLTTRGSFVFLGVLAVDLPLPADEPLRKNCGHCQRCLPACPTGAIVRPYVIDNSRCISYLTIELKGPIPRELRPLVGDRLFGCDLCQDVCPVNRRASERADPDLRVGTTVAGELDLVDLLGLDDGEFRRRFRHTALWRTKRRGLLRNAAVVLGNLGDARALPALVGALADPEPLVRGHAAWALGRLGDSDARSALTAALETEVDDWVREELELALAGDHVASGASI